MDYIVHGILQAIIVEWVAIPFSMGSSQPRDQIQVSCIAGGSLPLSHQGSLDDDDHDDDIPTVMNTTHFET